MRNIYLLMIFCLACLTYKASAQCSAQVISITPVTCNGMQDGAVDISASNGVEPYSYLWSNSQTTQDLTGVSAGTYTCTVSDAAGCTTTVSGVVVEPAALTLATFSPVTLNCFLIQTTISANPSGGTPPYAYYWQNNFFTQSIQVNAPGAYSVTVSDANGCTAVGTAIVTADITIPVACVLPPGILTCVLTSLTLDGTCSPQGPDLTYLWNTNSGNIVSGNTTLTPVINLPGVYYLLVTNTANGCTSISSVSVSQDILPPVANAGPDLQIACGTGGVVTLVGSTNIGNLANYQWTGPDIISGGNTANPIVGQAGTYSLTVTNTQNGCTDSDQMQVISQTTGLCSTIEGHLYTDTLENCQYDTGEPALFSFVIRATGANGTYYAVTDSMGFYQMAVESGDSYQLSVIPIGSAWVPCPDIPVIAVPNANMTIQANDLMIKRIPGCRQMSVDLTSGNLRPCFDNNFFSVQYCNIGTMHVEDAYILINLDDLLTMEGSQIPYTDLGNGQIRFNIGNVALGACGSFYFNTHLSCDAVLGQTHCTEAYIYPDSICDTPSGQWSGASIKISSVCDLDSVRFRIENVGVGNMPGALDYIVIEDQVMLMSAPLQLDAGEFTVVSVPANGSTWRLEMEQEPEHPGQSFPSVSVEGCTTGTTFSTGFVTQFPQNDADPFIDIHCVVNSNSFDPNDKQATPKGYGEEHYIRPGTQLEYLIRFQNTGTDTAFTVRIIDTLSAWLDPASIRPGASSHAYSWDLKDAGVLSFLFQNILLPDSNINEAASHGYVKFSILPKADAPLETIIYNTAEIYFDFNDPVATNTTFHRLGENFVTVGLWEPSESFYKIKVSPNPFQSTAMLEVLGLEKGSGLRLKVFDLLGKPVLEMESENNKFSLKRDAWPSGVYLFQVEQNHRTIGNGKLMVKN